MRAFPSPVDPKTGRNQLGITYRQYIAIQALNGMLANPALFDTNGEFSEDNIKVAFDIADVAIRIGGSE